jgi:hypothetical protein
MTGLDGRHRNEDGRIERKRGDTKGREPEGPIPRELKRFPDDTKLGDLRDRYHVDSLDALLRKLRSHSDELCGHVVANNVRQRRA